MTIETTGGQSLMGRWFPIRYVYLRDGDEVRAWALAPASSLDPSEHTPVERMLAVRMDQERLIARAESVAQTGPSGFSWPSVWPG